MANGRDFLQSIIVGTLRLQEMGDDELDKRAEELEEADNAVWAAVDWEDFE